MPDGVETELDPALEELLEFLRTSRGFDFSGYKRGSLGRRITKRMHSVGLDDYRSYRELLEAEPQEFVELFNTILINVTSFLRDGEAWQYLGDEVVPMLLDSRGQDAPLRAWSAGCASGEEAYSLAVVLCDAVGEDAFRQRVKVYGTDADEEALATARLGRYRASAVKGTLDSEQVERYFEADGDDMVFRKDLRRAVIFGRHDLVQDPPISRVDVLVCRNTLMYFNADTQRRILSNFHFALNDGGYLFLGKSEALVSRTGLFVPADHKRHVFQNERGARLGRSTFPPTTPQAGRAVPSDELGGLTFENAPVPQTVDHRA